MRSLYVSALISLTTLTGCVSAPKAPVDYAGRIFTQVTAEQMATCIGQATSVVPLQTRDSLVVNVSSAQPARVYAITRDKVQTVVTITGPFAPGASAADQAAIACAMPPIKATP